MRKKTTVICISILAIALFFTCACIDMEEVPVINLKAEVSVADEKTTLEIVSAEQDTISPLKSPKGTSANFPSVDAKAIINYGHGGVSYWAAKEYTGEGTYELLIGFEKDRVPKKDDVVKILVRVIGGNGKAIAGDTYILIWE